MPNILYNNQLESVLIWVPLDNRKAVKALVKVAHACFVEAGWTYGPRGRTPSKRKLRATIKDLASHLSEGTISVNSGRWMIRRCPGHGSRLEVAFIGDIDYESKEDINA